MEVWEFLSAWSDVYGLDCSQTLLGTINASLKVTDDITEIPSAMMRQNWQCCPHHSQKFSHNVAGDVWITRCPCHLSGSQPDTSKYARCASDAAWKIRYVLMSDCCGSSNTIENSTISWQVGWRYLDPQ